MPASPDNRRLVTYVPVAHAEEIARRAHADGRTVMMGSQWRAPVRHKGADWMGIPARTGRVPASPAGGATRHKADYATPR